MDNKIDTNNGEYIKPANFIILIIATIAVVTLMFYVLIPATYQEEVDTYFIIGVYHHTQDSGVSITAGTTNGLTHKSFNTNYLFKLGHAYLITSKGDNIISVVEVKLD